MKRSIVIAIAASVLAIMASSCGNTLATRNAVVGENGVVLPYVRSFDVADYARSAKKLMPSKAVCDSLAYLQGVSAGYEVKYQLGGDINLDEMKKGMRDFSKVDADAFLEAAQTNFTDSSAAPVVAKFAINPGDLGETMQAYIALNQIDTADVSIMRESLRDSASYLYGVLSAFRLSDKKLNQSQFMKGMNRFLEVDTEGRFMEFARSRFQDPEYPEFAKKFRIAPDKISDVNNRYSQALDAALVENVKVQSGLFLKEAAKVDGIEKLDVVFTEIVDSVEVETNSYILYRYTRLAAEDGPKVALGDSITVHYTGRHIDYSLFDQGEFPVDGLSNDGLIRGFVEGLQLLREGDEVEIVIPYEIGYGEMGSPNWWGGGYTIYPCETLVFTISVTDLRKPVEEPVADDADAAPAE